MSSCYKLQSLKAFPLAPVNGQLKIFVDFLIGMFFLPLIDHTYCPLGYSPDSVPSRPEVAQCAILPAVWSSTFEWAPHAFTMNCVTWRILSAEGAALVGWSSHTSMKICSAKTFADPLTSFSVFSLSHATSLPCSSPHNSKMTGWLSLWV